MGGHLSPDPGWVPSFIETAEIVRLRFRATQQALVDPAVGNIQNQYGAKDLVNYPGSKGI